MRRLFGPKPVWRRYIEEIMTEKGLIPTWPPGSPLNPGDLGTFQAGHFTGVGQTVADLGLPAPQVEIVDYKFDNEYQSRNGVDVVLKTDVGTSAAFQLLGNDLGFRAEFNRTGGLVFKARDCVEHRLVNIADYARAILRLPGWQKEWALVSNTWPADRTTAILGDGSGAALEVKLGARAGGPPLLVDVAADATFTILRRSSHLDVTLGQQAGVPLFRAVQVRFEHGRPKEAYYAPDGSVIASLAADVEALELQRENALAKGIRPEQRGVEGGFVGALLVQVSLEDIPDDDPLDMINESAAADTRTAGAGA